MLRIPGELQATEIERKALRHLARWDRRGSVTVQPVRSAAGRIQASIDPDRPGQWETHYEILPDGRFYHVRSGKIHNHMKVEI
jgi:hypothetical protein